jgi:hypothetical protein
MSSICNAGIIATAYGTSLHGSSCNLGTNEKEGRGRLTQTLQEAPLHCEPKDEGHLPLIPGYAAHIFTKEKAEDCGRIRGK